MTTAAAAAARARTVRMARVLALLLVLLGGEVLAQAPPVPTIKDLAVEGNRRIEAAAILNRIKMRIGDTFLPSTVREDVRAIFALGFFDDVQVRVEDFEGGVRVIFVVSERPLLREVGFEGNQAIKTEELRDKVTARIGTVYNPVDAQRGEDALRQKYEDEGYFGVVITPRTERTPEGDLRLVYRIEEGRKIYIDRIVIEGNHALSARQIKGAMQTKERFLWVLPFSNVQRRVFEEDGERILALYADHGYIQARLETHEIIPDLARGKVTLRTRVAEGPQFLVGTVGIKGNEVLKEADVRSLLRVKEGDVFSRSAVRASQRAIVDRYSDMGRARAEVTPEVQNDIPNRRVDIVFSIVEGGEVYVERIDITGNTKSSEKVLRREMRVAEGELFTYQKLVRSRERLFNLGFFDEVNVNVENGSTPDRVIIKVDVKERATGLFSIGAGYSSLDSLFATIDITQRNLFGRGQEVFLQFRIGSKSTLGLLGFTEPYLFDIPLRAGFDLYDRRREYDDYTEERLGGDIRASYPLAEYLTLAGVYRLENVDISDVAADASEDLKSQEGTSLNSVLSGALVYDNRDNVFEPSRGGRQALDVAFAGLGGDTQWWRVVGDLSYYFPLPVAFPASNWVWAVRGMAGIVEGWGGQEVPIFERFFLGGSTTLRGQRTRSVGPKDANGDTIGGTSEILFSTELIVPVYQRIRVAVFFDAGNAYGFGTSFDPADLRLSAGLGLRFFSPLGPLRLDYGFNLDRQKGEDSGQINFTVGAPF